MKLTIEEVLEAHAAIMLWVNRAGKDIPAALGLKVARIGRQLRAEAQLYQERRNALVGQYGTPDKDGRVGVDLGSEKGRQFAQADREMLQSDVELPIEPIELGDVNPGADVLMGVLPLLKGEETSKKGGEKT